MKQNKLMIIFGGKGKSDDDTDAEQDGGYDLEEAIADIEASTNLKITDPEQFCSAIRWLVDEYSEPVESADEPKPAGRSLADIL